ncbi:putative BsuMI modification methylase subunit YdiP [compost metagenome]
MRMLDLFSGIGGISLAADWAGIETVAFCEIEPFPQKVLRKNWPGIPIFEDVTKLSKQTLTEAGVIDDDHSIDIICGGYPCQPFSNAGKRQGQADDRHLWPEMFRLVRELRPTWVVGENVAGHISLGLDDVLADLESEGYQARAFVLPATAVGAPHRRERVFIVAHSGSEPKPQTNQTISSLRKKRKTRNDFTRRFGENLPGVYWKTHQPPVPGVDDGIPDRMDRSIAMGNAVVPQQIYSVFEAIQEIEQMQ